MSVCPHCKAEFKQVKMNATRAANLVKSWEAISFDCPACDASLSVCIDPVVIKNMTVDKIISRSQ